MSRVFDPVLADMQHEWTEAEGRGHRWLSRWVQVRGYWSLLWAIVEHLKVPLIAGAVITVVAVVKDIIALLK